MGPNVRAQARAIYFALALSMFVSGVAAWASWRGLNAPLIHVAFGIAGGFVGRASGLYVIARRKDRRVREDFERWNAIRENFGAWRRHGDRVKK